MNIINLMEILGGRNPNEKTKKLFTLEPADCAAYEQFGIRKREIETRIRDLNIDQGALDSDRNLWWRAIERKNNLAGKNLRYINGDVHEVVTEEGEANV